MLFDISKPLFTALSLTLLSLWMTCCSTPQYAIVEQPDIASISIVDRNGFAETISSPDRLQQYASIDFLRPQSYQKVTKVYARDQQGDIGSCITSYHPNGQPKQYLEVLNSRAFGTYREWYPNGSLKIESEVIGGIADISAAAESTWLFDGLNRAWDEDSNLLAEIYYEKGELQGVSLYYHPNGTVWKRIPYNKNLENGLVEVFRENGELLQQFQYHNGVREDISLRYWGPERIAAQENYRQGLLETGVYYDSCGKLIAEVKCGSGYRALFGKEVISELHEYHQGVVDGEVKVFGKQGQLVRLYHIKNNLKRGEEIEYYEIPIFTSNDSAFQLTPKLSISWYEGRIQGLVKTWYENGTMESRKEMSNNAKNGILTAWYRDGNLMLIEEYEKDKLVKGEYYKKGEKFPVSQVTNSKGTAMLFDADGNFLHKVTYMQGKPIDL